MTPQSTHTKQTRKNHYASGSSRGPRSATTLLAQVADIERGIRIRERREALHLTQPVVVDLIEDLAWKLPVTHRLHPDQPKRKDPEARSKAPVSLRGYQSWEAGGGIDWEKAKLLAGALQTDARWLVNGVAEGAPTPDLFPPATPTYPAEALEGALAEVLAEIKAQLAEQTRVLDEIKGYAVKVERMLGEQRDLKAETDAVQRLAREMIAGRKEAPRDSERALPRRAAAAKKRAAKSRTP